MSTPYAYCVYPTFNGATFFTVVCLPEKEGTFPTIILRSPYVDPQAKRSDEELCRLHLSVNSAFLEKGYAVVYQHCRGRGKSSGDCIPYINEREDGLCLQAWIREQPFYNGELYLYGLSYTASVHLVTAPFAEDIKGAILQVQDCERYNCNYRNGFYKRGLHGHWYTTMYKAKTLKDKNYNEQSYDMLPLSAFSQTVFGERAEDFDEILRHPDRDDPFWSTRYGGGEAHDAVRHARIPVLLITGFYDIYTGGMFAMWRGMDAQTRAQSALLVHPGHHGGTTKGQPIEFAGTETEEAFPHYATRWFDAIRGLDEPPVPTGQVTYYKLFGEQWCSDTFDEEKPTLTLPLGEGSATYTYDPNDPATFRGGLSANFGGCAWQDPPHVRQDILTYYTPVFTEDTFVKGQMAATLTVRSDCEDTCFYMRLSLCKNEGDYGLRDDINQLSNVCADYRPHTETEMPFTFDEHAFVIRKGERLRIDVSSSAMPHYVRHTNQKGLFSEQTTVKVATNTVVADRSFIRIPIVRNETVDR